jgi:Tfp pilus assembly protein PilX
MIWPVNHLLRWLDALRPLAAHERRLQRAERLLRRGEFELVQAEKARDPVSVSHARVKIDAAMMALNQLEGGVSEAPRPASHWLGAEARLSSVHPKAKETSHGPGCQ